MKSLYQPVISDALRSHQKKAELAIVVALLILPCLVHAQQASPAANCASQYQELSGKSPASLVAAGYSVSAAVPGGLWFLKGKELAYCNVRNSVAEGEALCWTLREPLKNQSCQ